MYELLWASSSPHPTHQTLSFRPHTVFHDGTWAVRSTSGPQHGHVSQERTKPPVPQLCQRIYLGYICYFTCGPG